MQMIEWTLKNTIYEKEKKIESLSVREPSVVMGATIAQNL